MSRSTQRIPVVILCGGQGTRFREQTERRPKPMIEVMGRPILWHIMSFYAGHGFTDDDSGAEGSRFCPNFAIQ